MSYLTGVTSGKLVDPLNLLPSDINIEDIAHSLALQNRYAGHTKFPLSVAQHSTILSYHVPKHLAFAALMHDAVEAFITDLPYPIKMRLDGYREMEDAVNASICSKFAIDPELLDAVKPYDRRICVDEMKQLCAFVDPELTVKALRVGQILELDWRDAEEDFLDRYYDLTREREDGNAGPAVVPVDVDKYLQGFVG